MVTINATPAPLIRRLTIQRFRGIKFLEWNPAQGINVILGGGDVGKTTILDAIALLLNPTNTVLLSDADYWGRDVENGFCIEAVMSLPEPCGIGQQSRTAWPWEWDGKEPKLPKIDQETSAVGNVERVYRLRVRGMEDFDVASEILQPDDSTDHLAVAVRRKIGLVRLSGDDRNDRDLRLVQGSALDRLLSDKTLRSRLGQKLAENESDGQDENLVFFEVGAGVVGTVDGGHEMRVVEGQGEQVEGDDPSVGVRLGEEQCGAMQGRGPCAAADDKVERRAVNPRRGGACGGYGFSVQAEKRSPVRESTSESAT
jgi:hypothetical protein